ncbi:Sialidase [Xylariaceae sp. FL1019]|nr:Sialidase [Xylariaceae sp. FL1019]
MGHDFRTLSRFRFRHLGRLIILLLISTFIMHKIIDHFKNHGDSQPHGQNAYPGQGPHHQSPQSQAQPSSWKVSSETNPLHDGGTYPRLCRLSDGSLLCSVTRMQDGTRILSVSRSTDNGRSFTPYGEITRGKGDVDNAFLLEVPIPGQNPAVLAAFRNHIKDEGGNPTHFRITVCRSTDGGKSWKFASQAASQSAAQSQGMGLWEPFMRLSASAPHPHTGIPVVQLTYSGEMAKVNQETFRVDSFDAGATWSSAPRCMRCHHHAENLRDGMQGIAVTQDMASGRKALVMVFETTRKAPHFSVEYVVSYDDGETWGDRGVVYVPRGEGRNAGSPQIAACKGGRLAVVFMCDEDVPEKKWPRFADVKAVFADGLSNGRIHWTPHPVVVGESPSHWPGVLCTAEDEVMVVYEHRGKPLGRLLHAT